MWSRPERSIHRIDGEFELVFGTSASSPVVGSLITLVNDARIAAGKGPVGKYRNPILTGRRNKLTYWTERFHKPNRRDALSTISEH